MSRPLDKQEAILYGRLVNAAYAMFKRDRKLLRPEPAPDDIPAPYELVAWLNMSDFIFWLREKPKFYGFIARHREQKHTLCWRFATRKARSSGSTTPWRFWCGFARCLTPVEWRAASTRSTARCKW